VVERAWEERKWRARRRAGLVWGLRTARRRGIPRAKPSPRVEEGAFAAGLSGFEDRRRPGALTTRCLFFFAPSLLTQGDTGSDREIQ